jgi:SAM-dependent methyltransferase
MPTNSNPRPVEQVVHISGKTGQFKYFDLQLGQPNWGERAILDFGGNVGKLLEDAELRIAPERYWCIDVAAYAIEIGQRRHPRAHWIHYDRYNCCFNPNGIPCLKVPDLGRTFDFILVYSVFTHVVPSEMQELIADLSSLMKPGGRLAFTFIDALHRSWPARSPIKNLQWRLEREWGTGKESLINDYLARVACKPWFALTNDLELHFDESDVLAYADRNSISSFHVFHSTPFIAELFPTAKIQEPVHDEMQHCCILEF